MCAPFEQRSAVSSKDTLDRPSATSEAPANSTRVPVAQTWVSRWPGVRVAPSSYNGQGAPLNDWYWALVIPSTPESKTVGAILRLASSSLATCAANRIACRCCSAPCHLANGVDQ